MSVFISPVTTNIPQADLLCAILLLAILSLKIITMNQASPMLANLNRSLSISLYPMAVIFGLLIFQYVML